MKKLKEIENKDGIEQLLKKLRKKNNWSYIEVVQNLKNKQITEKTVKKWEYGLEYPDLDMIYELSELYRIPSDELIEAKNTSFENGISSINITTIKWLCYFLNISVYAGIVILYLFYAVALILAFLFFLSMASMVKK